MLKLEPLNQDYIGIQINLLKQIDSSKSAINKFKQTEKKILKGVLVLNLT